jgi:hypothetical protein
MQQSEAVKEIFTRWWPAAGRDPSPQVPASRQGEREFLEAMAACQVELIEHYLPVMARDRVAWARRTLARLQGSHSA